MSHRPVCKTCELEYQCSENGVNVIDYSNRGPLAIAEADEFECPGCHHCIIVGFGSVHKRRGEEGFEDAIYTAVTGGFHRDNYVDERTKAIHKVPE